MKEILYGWLGIQIIVFYECLSFCYGVSWLSGSKIVFVYCAGGTGSDKLAVVRSDLSKILCLLYVWFTAL